MNAVRFMLETYNCGLFSLYWFQQIKLGFYGGPTKHDSNSRLKLLNQL